MGKSWGKLSSSQYLSFNMDFDNFPSPGAIPIHSLLTLICGQVNTKHVSAAEDECSFRFSVSSNSFVGSRIVGMGVLICWGKSSKFEITSKFSIAFSQVSPDWRIMEITGVFNISLH